MWEGEGVWGRVRVYGGGCMGEGVWGRVYGRSINSRIENDRYFSS